MEAAAWTGHPAALGWAGMGSSRVWAAEAARLPFPESSGRPWRHGDQQARGEHRPPRGMSGNRGPRPHPGKMVGAAEQGAERPGAAGVGEGQGSPGSLAAGRCGGRLGPGRKAGRPRVGPSRCGSEKPGRWRGDPDVYAVAPRIRAAGTPRWVVPRARHPSSDAGFALGFGAARAGPRVSGACPSESEVSRALRKLRFAPIADWRLEASSWLPLRPSILGSFALPPPPWGRQHA